MTTDRPRLRPLTVRPHRRARTLTARLVLAVLCLLVPAAPVTLASAVAAADGWGWPLQPPEVVNGFDPPDTPYGSGHRGVDLAGSAGQVVTAPSAGVVTFAGVIAGRGVVVVGHGELRSTLEPVVAGLVAGTTVAAGDPVGTLQGVGYHCDAPCLHWGVLRGETYLDPLDFVGIGPSRLLPWWNDSARADASMSDPPAASAHSPSVQAPGGSGATSTGVYPQVGTPSVARAELYRPAGTGGLAPAWSGRAGSSGPPPMPGAAARAGGADGSRASPPPWSDAGDRTVAMPTVALVGLALVGGLSVVALVGRAGRRVLGGPLRRRP